MSATGGPSAKRGEPLLLGLDLGTSALKVLLVALDGRIVGRASAGYPTERPGPDRAEQHANTYPVAVALVASGEYPVEAVISDRIPLDQAVMAFDKALNEKDRAIKVMVTL